MTRRTITSGYSSEEAFGYARAVCVDKHIYLSGTTARGDDLEKDVYGQTKAIIAIIEDTLREAGADLSHVVRTVTYLTDMKDEPLVAEAHREAFGLIKPASTLVAVSALSPSAARVEIQVDAVVG